VKEDTQEGVERIHRKVKRKYTGRRREDTQEREKRLRRKAKR
jgi:hypothetical protein